ncbi:MAG TPA: hypothetical protein VGK46_02970 [Saprospiraceae bacterium]
MKPSRLLSLSLIILLMNCSTRTAKEKPEEVVQVQTTEALNRATAKYTMQGVLIKAPSFIEEELIYDPSGYLKYHNSKSCGVGASCFLAKLTYDSLGHIRIMESYQGGQLSVFQENTYNDRNDLLTEYRIEEADEDAMDTTLFKYIYSYGAPGQKYVAYRLNNGDTVTMYTIQRKGAIKTTREEIYPRRKETFYTIKEEMFDDKEQIIEVHTETVMSDWYDRTKIDTSTTRTQNLYNAQGQKTRERYWQDNDLIKSDSLMYENGMVKKRYLTHRGKFYKIVYEHSVADVESEKVRQ